MVTTHWLVTTQAAIANAIAKDIASELPAENPRYFVGGHSAGGQAAVEALAAKAFAFPVHGFIGMAPYFNRADIPQTGRGDAAAATRLFRGDGSLWRRGRDADMPRRRVVVAPRL